MSDFKIKAMVFHAGGVALECESPLDFFWLDMGAGFASFLRVSGNTFAMQEMVSAGGAKPEKSYSAACVLWDRRAALEAHESITAYQAGH
jgi:hypothetical protein